MTEEDKEAPAAPNNEKQVGAPNADPSHQRSKRSANSKPAPSVNQIEDNDGVDRWLLEDVYPDVDGLLSPANSVSAGGADTIVVLDTNVLLLPFKVGNGDLTAIGVVYEKLIEEKRLFVPQRVLREFIKNRDKNIAEAIHGINNRKSQDAASERLEIPALLEGLEETAKAKDAAQKLSEARATYKKAVGALIDRMKTWRNDDPITAAYHRLFQGTVVIAHDSSLTREKIGADWDEKLRRKIPPGYKDGGKPDRGIGDYLIWLSILEVGRSQQKHLIFVTGEEKADWFVRQDKEGIYPRPELVDEYRRTSQGKILRLARLADILEELQAPEDVVEEVREAETAANNAVQAASLAAKAYVGTPTITVSGSGTISGGNVNVRTTFPSASSLAFTPVSIDMAGGAGFFTPPDESLEVLFLEGEGGIVNIFATSNGSQAFSFGPLRPGTLFDFSVTTPSRSFAGVQHNGVFSVVNDRGDGLVGRVRSIASSKMANARDEILFEYRLFPAGAIGVAP